jgi:UDP-N-acetyl-D-galactosamine dehydrogenase
MDMIRSLREYMSNVAVYDPWADSEAVKCEYGLDILSEMPFERFDAAVFAVAHEQFKALEVNAKVIYRVKKESYC